MANEPRHNPGNPSEVNPLGNPRNPHSVGNPRNPSEVNSRNPSQVPVVIRVIL